MSQIIVAAALLSVHSSLTLSLKVDCFPGLSIGAALRSVALSISVLSLPYSQSHLHCPIRHTQNKTSAVRSRVRDKFRFGAEQQAGTGSNVQ